MVPKLVCLLLMVSGVRTATGQVAPFVQLADPDPAIGRDFGAHVAIRGDHAFVSEPRVTPQGADGRVHVYHRYEGGYNAWGWVQTLLPPDGDGYYFGVGLHAAEDRLVVSRAAHSYAYAGATVCREHSLFIYELNELAQFELDTILGGRVVSDIPCTAIDPRNYVDSSGDHFTASFFPGYSGGCMSLFKVGSNNGSWTIPQYSSVCASDHCLKGDTLLYFSSNELVSQNWTGAPLISIPGLVSYGSDGSILASAKGMVAVGQPGGASINYEQGSVRIFDLEQPQFPEVAQVLEVGSTWEFGKAIDMNNNFLVALEGGGGGPQRLFVHRISSPENGQMEWAQVAILEDFPELPLGSYRSCVFDLSEQNNLGVSVSNIEGSFGLYVTRIYDLSTYVAVPEKGSPDADCQIVINGRMLSVRCARARAEEVTEARVFDMIGHDMIGAVRPSELSSGVDLGSLAPGAYLLKGVSKTDRWTKKFILP